MDDDMQAWAHALELEGQRWEHEQAAADNAEVTGGPLAARPVD